LLRAQQCANRSNFPLADVLKTRAPDTNGIIHVTYSFANSNITNADKLAFSIAIGQWNGVASSTKVTFEEASGGSAGDLVFSASDNQDLTAGCIAHNPINHHINYSQAFLERAEGSASAGASFVAH
jgi:hypothetical protein